MDLRPTKEIALTLKQRYEHSAETGESPKTVILKYFNPVGAGTWYIMEGMPLDANGEPTEVEKAADWHLYGYADLGDPVNAEFGYVLLSELQSVKLPFGLGIERDLYFDETPVAEVVH